MAESSGIGHNEHPETHAPTRRRFMASAIGAVAGVGLSRQMIPRAARAALGLTKSPPRVLGYREVGMPSEVQRPVSALTRRLADEGFELRPAAYRIDYEYRGAVQAITRVWGHATNGRETAGVVAVPGAPDPAAAFVQRADNEAIERFRLFFPVGDEVAETARLKFGKTELARIQVIEDAPHTAAQLEWLGRALRVSPADRKNCYCCMGCCYPSQGGGAFCSLFADIACGAASQVTKACNKDPRAWLVCTTTCWAVNNVLCSEGQTLSSCDSCSKLCDWEYGMKPGCCPGEQCGHAGCYDG